MLPMYFNGVSFDDLAASLELDEIDLVRASHVLTGLGCGA
jgi:hypothetical protein